MGPLCECDLCFFIVLLVQFLWNTNKWKIYKCSLIKKEKCISLQMENNEVVLEKKKLNVGVFVHGFIYIVIF